MAPKTHLPPRHGTFCSVVDGRAASSPEPQKWRSLNPYTLTGVALISRWHGLVHFNSILGRISRYSVTHSQGWAIEKHPGTGSLSAASQNLPDGRATSLLRARLAVRPYRQGQGTWAPTLRMTRALVYHSRLPLKPRNWDQGPAHQHNTKATCGGQLVSAL